MRDPKTRALSNAVHWLNQCYDFGLTAEEIIARSKEITRQAARPAARQAAASPIEKGKEKRDIPPTPPIESKEKQKDNASLARAREDVEACKQAFEAFWTAYPVGHKFAKKKCYKKFAARFYAADDQATFINAVLGGLDKWKHCGRWKDGIICNPETFLNQERWLDAAPNDEEKHSHSFRKVGGVSQTANTHSERMVGAW